jgi:hypothetical protein
MAATELTFATHFEGSVFCPLQGLVQLLIIPFANFLLIICILNETALEFRRKMKWSNVAGFCIIGEAVYL